MLSFIHGAVPHIAGLLAVIEKTPVHTQGVNWSAVAAISGPAIFVMGTVGKLLSNKLDKVGDHLRQQDEAKGLLSERIARIEGQLGMVPVKEPQ